MKIAMISPGIALSAGGPSYSTMNLCRALSGCGVEVTLLTQQSNNDAPLTSEHNFSIKYFEPSIPKRYANSNSMVKFLRLFPDRYDIIHISSLWNLFSTRAAHAAYSINVPYVISPRGMLSAWNHCIRNCHKYLYYYLLDHKIVQRAACIHFLTKEEADLSHFCTKKLNQIIVPNGIWLKEYKELNPEIFRHKYNLGSSQFVLFLGRLNKIKRLDLQCKAFHILSKSFTNLKWVFAGPDAGMRKWIEQYSTINSLKDRILLTGLLTGEDRLSALAAANIYCQTSDHEAHSMAITEALAAGKPCVVTKGCHYDLIESYHAGHIVPSDPKSLAAAIAILLSSPMQMNYMGQNAIALVRDHFQWESIGRKMVEAYTKILESKSKS
jgi:glycosyltransferase involved in cell wall biosynthesis